MADSLVTADTATAVDARPAISPVGEVIRDIARGGIAGILVGIVVAGLGGRIVMRLAAILHEDAVGMFTENGEVIGHITVPGTLALMTFGGLGMGFVAGTIWVIVGPWIPFQGRGRAIAAGLAAVALGTPLLVQRSNSDFVVLDHDPIVIALLIGLVGVVGGSMALMDRFLDRRLPRLAGPGSASFVAYVVVALAGLVLILPLVVSILLFQTEYAAPLRVGWGLAIVGACTLTWWALRAMGRSEPPTALRLAGTGSLALALVLGVATSVPHILGAAGLR